MFLRSAFHLILQEALEELHIRPLAVNRLAVPRFQRCQNPGEPELLELELQLRVQMVTLSATHRAHRPPGGQSHSSFHTPLDAPPVGNFAKLAADIERSRESHLKPPGSVTPSRMEYQGFSYQVRREGWNLVFSPERALAGLAAAV